MAIRKMTFSLSEKLATDSGTMPLA